MEYNNVQQHHTPVSVGVGAALEQIDPLDNRTQSAADRGLWHPEVCHADETTGFPRVVGIAICPTAGHFGEHTVSQPALEMLLQRLLHIFGFNAAMLPRYAPPTQPGLTMPAYVPSTS